MNNNYKSKNYYNIMPITLNYNLLDIADVLKELKQIKISRLSDTNIYDIIHKSKIFFLENSIKLTSIPFIPHNLLQELNFINKNGNLNSFINLINRHLTYLYPTEIPIFLDKSLGIEGGYCNPVYIGNNDDIKKLIFTEFIITDKLSILTPGIYTHEIIHSQLEYNNGVNNYIHSEVLPIFFDKLVALYIDDNYETLKANEILRFIRLYKSIMLLKKENISFYHKSKLSMIIVSILEAESLFDKYLYGTQNDKNNIIFNIKNVLCGNLKVEDLLKSENITIENCQSKQIIKKRCTSLF